jgi:hypothetical protein
MRYVAAFLLLPIGVALPGAGHASEISDSAVVAPPSDVVDMISYTETGPNGNGLVHWYIRPGGEGRYQSKGRRERGAIDRPLTAGAAGFAKIEALLAPLETRRGMRCQQIMDDRATGKLSWTRGDRSVTLHLDHGCVAATDETAPAALDAVNELILHWAKTYRWDADTRYDPILTCGPR